MKRATLGVAALALLLFGAGAAEAGMVQAGDLIVVDRRNGTIDDVNPTSGKSFVIASGFTNPHGLAINA